MGFLEKIVGKRAEGDSSTIAPANFMQQTDQTAITPENGDLFIQKNHSTIPICGEPRGFTRDEAAEIEARVALNQHLATNATKAFRALGRNAHHDAAIQVAHRHYLGQVATAELKKVGANAQLGKVLHGLRPGYAALGLGLDNAQRTADQKVSVLKARIAGILE